MPQKIDGISYPKTAAELLTDRDLTRLVMQTFKSAEVRHRLRFLINPPTPDKVFSEFIAPRSRTPISFPAHITQNAMDLVNDDNYDAALWKGIFDLAEANCRQFIEGKVLPAFFDESKCKNFETYHMLKLFKAGEKKYGKLNDLMARLNLTDAPSVKSLLASMYRGDRKDIHTFAVYTIRKANLNAQPESLIDAIKTGKGLTNTGAFSVDAKKLSVLGFAKPKDKKLKNRVEDMVNAWMSGDKTTAKQIFQLIQKSEPNDSFVKKDTIENLFKSFKKFKVVIG